MSIHTAFIGAGNMASAMVMGLIKAPQEPNTIACTSADDGTGEKLSQSTGILYYSEMTEMLSDLRDSAKAPGIIVLAIKPQQLLELPPEVRELSAGKIILSILAGTPLAKLKNAFPQAKNIIRSMPNTPGQIGAGVTAYASQTKLEKTHTEAVEEILSALGRVFPVKESKIDAVTAVSGSGPAYLFEFVAAFRNAGIRAGLEDDLAYELALETVLGASKLLKESAESPDVLRDRVTSPNGTTQAALEVFEKGDLRELVKEAVLAAKNRSIELAKA